MEIADNRVVSFHYTLTGSDAQIIDQSSGEPLSYLHGAGNIVVGLEKALTGKQAGDRFDVDVGPEEGYGLRDDQLTQSVPREAFQGVDVIQPGMQFSAQTPQGSLMVTVVEVDDTMVKIDQNHPLAGETLHFAVEITDVRDATQEELQAGRALG